MKEPSGPEIVCVGLNHSTAPLEIRELISFSKDELRQALPRLRSYVPEGVILSTCNRTEVYALGSDHEGSALAISHFLADFHALDAGRFTPYVYCLRGEETARHLFRVAAGLDSMILGESQILGQVRDALTATAAVASPAVPLSRLFHYALRTGRRVRAETELGANTLSVSYAGVRLAQRVLGDLRGSSALLMGAGESGRLVARALRTVGVLELVISNRTFSRAEELARELLGRPLPFHHLSNALRECDIVISCTDAPGVVLNRGAVAMAMDAREGRPLFFFDLAVPRDIDPEVAGIQGVYLYNIDDLEVIAEANRLERQKWVKAAEAIVEEEVARFGGWWRSMEAVSLIKGLRQEAEAIRRAELEKMLRHLKDLTPEQQRAMERFSRAIVKKLLHHPLTALKEPRALSHLQAIKELFEAEDVSGPGPAG